MRSQSKNPQDIFSPGGVVLWRGSHCSATLPPGGFSKQDLETDATGAVSPTKKKSPGIGSVCTSHNCRYRALAYRQKYASQGFLQCFPVGRWPACGEKGHHGPVAQLAERGARAIKLGTQMRFKSYPVHHAPKNGLYAWGAAGLPSLASENEKGAVSSL